MLAEALRALKKYYGYTEFREGQGKIIKSILEGRDTLGIMPTGGGKSICYQIPALLASGVTVVISPLISLMKDQVDTLSELGIAATYINSSIPAAEAGRRLRAVQHGEYKLIYIAPERLESMPFRSLLTSLPISLLAVDEAHCVSQWGHDFRPSYLAIGQLVTELHPRPVLAAFTATATEAVTKDIVAQLGLKRPDIHVTGFDRANLFFAVLKGEDKLDYLLQYLRQNKTKSGIIYAATRREVEKLADYLGKKGFATGRYHAGLNDQERSRNQEEFINDNIRVMVATNAFGMGIDKSNVRFVIHYNMPKNMEAYYQEAGRAGRDGEPAECILLFSPQDVLVQKFLIEQSVSEPERKSAEYRKLQDMVDYCHTTNCLRSYILEYFGEKSGEKACDNCSNCKDLTETRDITVPAQKIFSCILRMNERFGVTLVAEVLKGSNNKKVQQFGFKRLSTYGLLQELTLKEISGLINWLIAEKYLILTEGQYPVVKLTPQALTALKNRSQVVQKVRLEQPEPKGDDRLFEILRALRKGVADQEGVPPYVIFPDSTLRQMCEKLPSDEEGLLQVSGVGERKLQRYGEQFLAAIAGYLAEFAPEERESLQQKRDVGTMKRKNDSAARQEVPSHVTTYHLYKTGQDLATVAAMRGLKAETVMQHLLRCAEEGLPVKWNLFIPDEQEQLILGVIKKLGAEKLKPLKEALPEEVSYIAIKAVICKYRLLA